MSRRLWCCALSLLGWGCVEGGVSIQLDDARVGEARPRADGGVAPLEGDAGLSPDPGVPTGFTEAGYAGELELPDTSNRCVAYLRSARARPRGERVQVGPNDDWRAAIAEAAPSTEVVLAPGRYDVPLEVLT